MTGLTTRRAALLGGAAAAMAASPAHAQLLEAFRAARQQQQQEQQQQQQQQQAQQGPVLPGRQELAPLGYALEFQTVRTLIASGDFLGARTLYQNGPTPDPATLTAATGQQPAGEAEQQPRLFSASDVFLSNSEMGLMSFDGSVFPDSTTHFGQAHDAVLAERNVTTGGSTLRRIGRGAGRLLRRGAAFVTGRDELAVYRQRDYERILQLNYLALSYLVPGDRRAYNVNRLAIEEQDLARRNFEEEIAEAQTRMASARADASNGASAGNAADGFQREFESYNSIAGRVPSAYVNPLGFYLSGVIQEITSAERPALRGNARNSYQAALDLIGQSPQLSAAIMAMQAPPNPSRKVMHVIIGEGFAPTRQALRYGVQVNQQVVPIRIPIFVPNNSSITRVEVANARNQVIGRLDPMGDVEALVMRAQQDRMPQILIGVIASAWRASAEQRFASGMGEIASSVMQYKQNFDSPDMRSWSSLPSRFYVGRIEMPLATQDVRINSYAGTRLLHTQTVRPTSADLQQSVIYGRVTDAALRIEQPRRLWIDGIDEESPT